MNEKVLHPKTKRLLVQLTPEHFPKDTYLGGGSAIALHLGHRRSVDLDFFTPREFIEQQWERKLTEELGFSLIQRDWQTLIGEMRGVKFSLFGYPYRLIREKTHFLKVEVASLPDLAAMKLDTVTRRGTRRDLIDLYFLAHHFSLEKLLRFYQLKYGKLPERELMIKKALVFFDDAENDEMPEMLLKVRWEEVKKYLIAEATK